MASRVEKSRKSLYLLTDLALAKLVSRANCVPLLGGGDPAQRGNSNDIKGKYLALRSVTVVRCLGGVSHVRPEAQWRTGKWRRAPQEHRHGRVLREVAAVDLAVLLGLRQLAELAGSVRAAAALRLPFAGDRHADDGRPDFRRWAAGFRRGALVQLPGGSLRPHGAELSCDTNSWYRRSNGPAAAEREPGSGRYGVCTGCVLLCLKPSHEFCWGRGAGLNQQPCSEKLFRLAWSHSGFES